jgi:hypothetical protein
MADDDDANVFKPDTFAVSTAPDRTDIRLVWERDNGERLTVALEQSQVASVLLELQKQIAPGSGVPINLASFRPGASIAVTGLGFGPRPDHFVLTAYVDLLDQGRGVTVPLRFSKEDVESCVTAMTRWLSQRGDRPAPPRDGGA